MRPNRAILAGFLAAILAVLAGITLAKGGFYLGKHEGDTLHMLQIAIRMSQGQWPHLDFMTPIGVLAFAPFALFIKAGFGAGHAILYGQVFVACLFFPMILWVAQSRFRTGWAALFGGGILVLILALVHGEADRSVSISMHYNRWAWAAAFLAITTALLPPRSGRHSVADGVVIGLCLAAMALIKITFFAAFAVPVLVALVGRRAFRTLAWTLAGGLALAAVFTALAGVEFWLAYLGDLLTVAGSEVRSEPGLPFMAVIGAPAYFGGSLALILAVILLRQAGRSLEGLVTLLLVPGFFYVTYQNFGNDPQWLGLLGILLFALRPEEEVHNALGWELRKALTLTGMAAFAFATPSYVNLAYSPYRHLTVDVAKHTPLLHGQPLHEDLKTLRIRAMRVDGRIALDGPGTPFAAFTDAAFREEDVATFRGEDMPNCSIELGVVAWFTAISDDLKATGLSDGKTVFSADLLSSYWLYGAFEPLPGGAPWYYGGLSGFAAADYLLVPLCPLSPSTRKLILNEVEAAGVELTELRRTELYILYGK